MKNHEWVEGRLLQTNKKWSQLKERQKKWVYEAARIEYARFVAERGKQPVHGSKMALIERIYEQIVERGIWIPFEEVSRVLSSRIAHWSRGSVTDGLDPEQATSPVSE